VLHKIQLCKSFGGNLTEVLSEGECKIVSLAAFLADVTGKKMKTPFIFDDPITSLDQNFEEAVAKRLIKLSQENQVIIFTHRMPLISTIKHLAEKESIKIEVVNIRSTDWGKGEPAPIPLSQNDIKTTLNLINERVVFLTKNKNDLDFIKTESDVKSICSEFRILIEKIIENDLLSGIVQRDQRSVRTQKIRFLK
jgi:wobble nucleotide-excising tRNase